MFLDVIYIEKKEPAVILEMTDQLETRCVPFRPNNHDAFAIVPKLLLSEVPHIVDSWEPHSDMTVGIVQHPETHQLCFVFALGGEGPGYHCYVTNGPLEEGYIVVSTLPLDRTLAQDAVERAFHPGEAQHGTE